jgi:glycosyltransferase involved in cell wall biosynthesis
MTRHADDGRAARRVKIAYVTQSGGGVETIILMVLRNTSGAEFESHVVCPPGSSLETAASAMGFPVHPIKMVRSANPLIDAAALYSLATLFRRERFDVVHVYSAKAGFLGRLAARYCGVPSVYSPQAWSYLSQTGPARGVFKFLERLAVPFTDVVVAASQSEKNRGVRELGYRPEIIRTINNSVDFAEEIQPVPTSSIQPPVVLTSGRLIFQKNPEMFIRVAQRVHTERPDVQFIMSGAGFESPLEASIREMVRSLGLSGCVAIVPWSTKQESLRLMSRCSVFVLTSRFEGMPNVLLEAMMLAKPIVATDVDGSRDAVIPGSTGFLVGSDDDRHMAERIMWLIDNNHESQQIGQRGRRLAEERHDIRNNIKTLEELYRSAIASSLTKARST